MQNGVYEWFRSEPFLNIVILIAIVIGGYFIAAVLRLAIRRALARTDFDERIAGALLGPARARSVDTGKWVSTVVFYVVLGFVAVAALQRIGLGAAAEPVNDLLRKVFGFLPNIAAAALIMLAAWAVATILRRVVRTVLEKTSLDDSLGKELRDEEQGVPASQTIGDTVYWLVFLVFLPAALSALQLFGLLNPVRDMLARALTFLPNLFIAAVILFVGWIVARLVQRIVTNLLTSAGADDLATRMGFDKALGEQRMSQVLGLVVYVLILIPVAIAALNALQLDAITRPASAMLQTVFDALPRIFAAVIVLGLSYVVGRMVAELVRNLLSSAGFDRVLVKIGVAKDTPDADERTPSRVVGHIVLAGVMLFAFVEAANLLDFGRVADLVSDLLLLGGRIVLGLIIMGLGFWLANLAASAVESSNAAQAKLLATTARASIVVLATAMGLRQMGIANEIIELAFGLMLGAVAVAFALAFGLGAREEAGAQVREWRNKRKHDPRNLTP